MGDPGPAVQTGDWGSPAAVPLEVLLPLMRARGVTISPKGFHAAVNEVFHAFEAACYDRIHRDMWDSLPQQFELLVDDYLRRHVPKRRVRVLDIGCGTGLSAQLLSRTQLGPYIDAIDLLDTSPEMLEACRRRGLRGARRFIPGTIEDVPVRPAYDVIVACSVLHHIPDISTLARAVTQRQTPGGVFLHLQDPNADYHHDLERVRRERAWSESSAARVRSALKGASLSRLARAVARRLKRARDRSFICLINEELMRRQVTREPMSAEELWSVTDLHEHHAIGISIDTLGGLLPEYELLSRRSYAFFGELEAKLPGRFRRMERLWITCRAQNGSRTGALWIRKGDSRIHE